VTGVIIASLRLVDSIVWFDFTPQHELVILE